MVEGFGISIGHASFDRLQGGFIGYVKMFSDFALVLSIHWRSGPPLVWPDRAIVGTNSYRSENLNLFA